VYEAGLAQVVECLTASWTTGRSVFDPRQGKRIFPLSYVSRPALGPTHSPIQWVGGGVLSPGAKRGRGVRLTAHPHPVPRSQMNRSYTSSTPSASFACSGTDLLYFNFYKSLISYVNINQRITYKNQVLCLYALMYSMITALKKVANV
jgi:hypothetical protein